MDGLKKRGFPLIGAIFLGVGVVKLLQGGGWIVWFLLAFLFGAFSLFKSNKDGGDAA
ncbi:hypothetical protein A6F65_01808 [Paraurantiacibacter namhicola]|uniref:Uncharacterized protein n=2 Tax=Paraurantiacibacter namhicola TaxID=645517 RepID=A0A1C7D9X0_9SPHN|nr:hypothetical protein A6F65_01808 [Paraurantiacibacter namhicola]